MKIALCFYGHMRYWKTNQLLWKRFIDKHNMDVFIHTWDTEAYKDNTEITPSDYSGLLTAGAKPLDVRGIKKAYNPVKMVVERYDDMHQVFVEKTKWQGEYRKEYLEKFPDRPWVQLHKDVPTISMFYKWWRVSQLKQRHELDNDFLYDIVFHTRSDFALTDPFDFQFIPPAVCTPPWPNSPSTQPWVDYSKGLNDYWAYGPSKAMDIFCSVYPRIDYIWQLCMSESPHGFEHACNTHELSVLNMAQSGITVYQKEQDQRGNVLR